MSIEVFPPCKSARALEHDVHVQRLPGQARRISFAQQRQPVFTNGEVSARCFDRLLIPPVDGVVFQEVHDIVGTTDVIGGDQLQTRRVHHNLERGSTDPPQSIDGDLGHELSLVCAQQAPQI